MPLLPTADEAGDGELGFVEAEEPADAARMVVRLVAELLPQRYGLDPLGDIQVLTPMQRGELGARNLNLELQKALNPEGPSVRCVE